MKLSLSVVFAFFMAASAFASDYQTVSYQCQDRRSDGNDPTNLVITGGTAVMSGFTSYYLDPVKSALDPQHVVFVAYIKGQTVAMFIENKVTDRADFSLNGVHLSGLPVAMKLHGVPYFCTLQTAR